MQTPDWLKIAHEAVLQTLARLSSGRSILSFEFMARMRNLYALSMALIFASSGDATFFYLKAICRPAPFPGANDTAARSFGALGAKDSGL